MAPCGAELRSAGRQGRAIGIEEAAAIAGDAVRVGDDDVGLLATDLDGAFELAGIRAGHLVQDDPRGGQAQLQVAGDPAADLRLDIAGAVVEDQALGVDVELVVLVAADAGFAGRGDQDNGRAIGGGIDEGLLPGGCHRRGGELRIGGHRGEQRLGDKQGGERAGHAAQPGARGRRAGRLCELALQDSLCFGEPGCEGVQMRLRMTIHSFSLIPELLRSSA